MRYEIIFGGKAGQGPNILSEVVSQGLIASGFHVFYSRDYQSLIRGGHNFNQLSFSDKPVFSNQSIADVLVCLDEKTEEIHKRNLNKNAIIMKFQAGKGNMFFAGALFKLLGMDFKKLENELKKLKNFDENMKEAKEGYENEKRSLGINCKGECVFNLELMNGSHAMAKAAIKSGLGFYYAYPMTPATPLMMELGQLTLEKENKHKVIELENEIAVMIAALGSSIVGGVSMAGTSGGGFDLMTEGLSMAGMSEIPIVIYLSSRPGPGTGVATYTGQGDLNMALYSGHGEFSRVVIAPGNPEESYKTINDCFILSQKFRIPCILLGDKHLGESKFSTIARDFAKISEIKSSIKVGERFNSYESDKSKDNTATEDSSVIKANFDKRMKKHQEIKDFCGKNYEMFKVYGNKNSKNLIISWGSTKGAILDAISHSDIDAKFIQVLFIEPFPSKELEEEIKKAKKVIIIENNATGQLTSFIGDKTCFRIEDKNKIFRYDGRPFFSDELENEIKKRIK